jgi:hypothetical protein
VISVPPPGVRMITASGLSLTNAWNAAHNVAYDETDLFMCHAPMRRGRSLEWA